MKLCVSFQSEKLTCCLKWNILVIQSTLILKAHLNQKMHLYSCFDTSLCQECVQNHVRMIKIPLELLASEQRNVYVFGLEQHEGE